MTTVYLIRHGELMYKTNERGQKMLYGPDAPLSAYGRNQIVALADRLKKEGGRIDNVYTSPYARAMESAQILAREFGIPRIVPVDNLRDIDNSRAMSLTLDEVLARKGDFASDSGVEPLEHLAARMYEAFHSIVAGEQNKALAVVSHGDAIRTLLYRLEHPNDEIPPMTMLALYDYLDKGEAWRLKLDTGIHIVAKEYVGRPPELWGKGERKS